MRICRYLKSPWGRIRSYPYPSCFRPFWGYSYENKERKGNLNADRQTEGESGICKRRKQEDSGTVEHLKANWTLVCDKLHEVHGESPDSPAGADAKLARAMIQQLDSAMDEIEPKQFFDIVLLNWEDLKELEQMYVALASVVNLTVGWLNATKAYEDLRMLFKSIDDVY